ncbi:MAG: IMP cyclohydrolase [Candidatus Doudnabacteria bacterium]|nr:IMP cyclohydrolase [Candidatus Doudnabacteria bacterium]
MPSALISVTDKTGIVELARALLGRGYELVSTGGTARVIEAGGVPVVHISDVTGFPEMMDGRVKTLHPAVFAGILARRANASDMHSLEQHGLHPYDIVVVNLYQFEQSAREAIGFDDLVEEIDIGGPSLLRAAAKNWRDVLVVCDPKDYGLLLMELGQSEGPSLDFRIYLARKVFDLTSNTDRLIWTQFVGAWVKNGEVRRSLQRTGVL